MPIVRRWGKRNPLDEAAPKVVSFRIAGEASAKAVFAKKRAENGLLAALNRVFVFTNRYIGHAWPN